MVATFRYVWFGWRDLGHLWSQVKYDMIYCWHCLTQWRNLNLNSFLLDAMPLYHVVRQTKKPPNLFLYSLVHTSFSPCSLTQRCLLHIGACQKEQFFFTSCDMYDTHTDTLEVTASLFMKSFLLPFCYPVGQNLPVLRWPVALWKGPAWWIRRLICDTNKDIASFPWAPNVSLHCINCVYIYLYIYVYISINIINIYNH